MTTRRFVPGGSGRGSPFRPVGSNLGKFDGQYTESLTVTGPGTFTTVAEMLFTGLDNAPNGLAVAGTTTGLAQGNGYEIYALFNSSGTFSTVGTVTTFSSTVGSATLYVDPKLDTTFVVGGTSGGTADDQILANATLLLGSGHVDPADPLCSTAECGSFGLLFSDSLTPLGSTYFISPNPFYVRAALNGVFDPFPLSGTNDVSGSGNLFFTPSPVPEPATLTLLGIGLLGTAAARRRRRQSNG